MIQTAQDPVMTQNISRICTMAINQTFSIDPPSHHLTSAMTIIAETESTSRVSRLRSLIAADINSDTTCLVHRQQAHSNRKLGRCHSIRGDCWSQPTLLSEEVSRTVKTGLTSSLGTTVRSDPSC